MPIAYLYQQMQLPEQLLKEISILLDKPVSPKVSSELCSIISKQCVPVEKSVHLLLSKCRSDLLLHLFEHDRFPVSLLSLSNRILSAINDYGHKMGEVIRIFGLVLKRAGNQQHSQQLLEIGYTKPMRMSVKQPNLQTKQLLLRIISANLQYLLTALRSKGLLRTVIGNFMQIYNKYLIYVPSYPKIMQQVLKMDSKSKAIINHLHPEREEVIQDVIVDLSSEEMSRICKQTQKILINTHDKANSYQLHTNCMKVMTEIGCTLNNYRVKEADLYFQEIDVGDIIRLLELFVGRKGTADEARLCKSVWLERGKQLQQTKVLKSEKLMEPRVEQTENPILIEDVISLTNNYRLKYEVQTRNKQDSRIFLQSAHDYLKKGLGSGGGKTNLVGQNRCDRTPLEAKSSYDKIIDSCFNNMQEQIKYNSYLQPEAPQHEHHAFPGSRLASLSHSELVEAPIVLGQQAQNDSQEIQEIGNLIDLAYSYKFS